MLKLKGQNAFLQKTKRQQAQITRGAQAYWRAKVYEVARYAVLRTPQWSATLVNSWTIQTSTFPGAAPVNRPLFLWKAPPVESSGDFKANQRAVLSRLKVELLKVRYNTKVSILNTAEYADDLTLGIKPDRQDKKSVLASDLGIHWRDLNKDNVKDANYILASYKWNILTAVYAKFRFLGYSADGARYVPPDFDSPYDAASARYGGVKYFSPP